MRAAVMSAPFGIAVQEVPKPAPGPNDVRVRILNAGICGSDIHIYDGTYAYAKYPHVHGHELSGVVETAGSEVTKLKTGDRVVIEPAIACGECYACRINKPNCCVTLEVIGIMRPGGFAEYTVVDENHVHVIPDKMSFEAGAIVEPFTIGAQIVSRAGVKPGNTVTILGAGPIGLTALILLKELHEVKVTIVDVIPERLALADLFGADVTINANGTNVNHTIMELTNNEGSNIVIETAGLRQTMEQTIDLVSSGGRIVIAGLTTDKVGIPGYLFSNKEVEIYGSRNSAGKFPEVIDFLTQHHEIADKFITNKMPLEKIDEAFRLAKFEPQVVNKIILQI